MPNPDRTVFDADPSARPPRFFLYRVLAVLASFVVIVTGLFAPVEWVRYITTYFAATAAPIALTVAIVYGRRAVRAFAIGGIFHCVLVYACVWSDKFGKVSGLAALGDELAVAASVGIGVLLIVGGGLVAVVVRWFIGVPPMRTSYVAVPVETPEAELRERRPFQFSLRSMFIATTLVALVCGGLFAPISAVVGMTALCLATITPVALTIAIVYGRGYPRTFGIGAIFPAGLMLLWGISPFSGGLGFVALCTDADSPIDDSTRVAIAVGTGIYAGFILVSGLVAVGVRWLIESPRRAEHPHHVHWDSPSVVRDSAIGTLASEETAIETAGR
ncbi:MAG: hypothetical protein ABFC96_18665 [Thermoguttaceae bacterium]